MKNVFVKVKKASFEMPKLNLSKNNDSVFYLNRRQFDVLRKLRNEEYQLLQKTGDFLSIETKFTFQIQKAVKTYISGESFGELALLNNKPRAANIVCLEECDFAVLSK